MGALFGSPHYPPPPPPPPPPPNPPTLANASVGQAAAAAARQAAAAEGAGFADTVLTSPQGTGQTMSSAPSLTGSQGKSLLGG